MQENEGRILEISKFSRKKFGIGIEKFGTLSHEVFLQGLTFSKPGNPENKPEKLEI